MEMIKEASLRKFVQHRAAGSDEDYNKLSNYLSREIIRKRRTQRILNSKHTHREHFTSHQRQRTREHVQTVPGTCFARVGPCQSDSKWRYLEEPTLYKQNILTLQPWAKQCPLRNAAFNKGYERPRNYRFLRTMNPNRSPCKEIQPGQDKSCELTEKQYRLQTQAHFHTFNKILKSRMARPETRMNMTLY